MELSIEVSLDVYSVTDHFPFAVNVPDRDYHGMLDWCRKHVGGEGVKWAMMLDYKSPTELDITYYFLEQSDAVQFGLIWS